MHEIQKILRNIGLTQNESIIYLELVKKGLCTTGKLLKDLNISKGRIYENLESLKKKGLISETNINNTRHFESAPTTNLLEFLKEKKTQILNEELKIKKILPELENLRTEKEEITKTFIFYGFQGFKSCISQANNMLTTKDTILVMGASGKRGSKYDNYWINWTKNLENIDTKMKILFNNEEGIYKTIKQINNVDTKISNVNLPTAIEIFGDKTSLILNYEKEKFILIIDEETTVSFKKLFHNMWELN